MQELLAIFYTFFGIVLFLFAFLFEIIGHPDHFFEQEVPVTFLLLVDFGLIV